MIEAQDTAKFSQSRNDMYWTFFDIEDGTIRWTGYDDSYWWSNVSKSESFKVKKGQKTGRIYTLNAETNTVTIEK